MTVSTSYNQKILDKYKDRVVNVQNFAIKNFGNRTLFSLYAKFVKNDHMKYIELEEESGTSIVDYIDAYHVIQLNFAKRANNLFDFDLQSEIYFIDVDGNWRELLKHGESLSTKVSEEYIINRMLDSKKYEINTFSKIEQLILNILHVDSIQLYNNLISLADGDSVEYAKVLYNDDYVSKLERDNITDFHDMNEITFMIGNAFHNYVKLHNIMFNINGITHYVNPINELGMYILEVEENQYILNGPLLLQMIDRKTKDRMSYSRLNSKLISYCEISKKDVEMLLDVLRDNHVTFEYFETLTTNVGSLLPIERRFELSKLPLIIKYHVINAVKFTENEKHSFKVYFDADKLQFIVNDSIRHSSIFTLIHEMKTILKIS